MTDSEIRYRMLNAKRNRGIGAFLAVVALVVMVVVVVVSPGIDIPAHADEQVVCIITETITWNPPLKNEAQQVTFTINGQLTGCNGVSATAT
jgi:hypothetical protein